VNRLKNWSKGFSFILIAILAFSLAFSPVQADASSANANAKKEYLVGFTKGNKASAKSSKSLIQAAGGDIEHTFQYMEAVHVTLPEKAAQALRNNPISPMWKKMQRYSLQRRLLLGVFLTLKQIKPMLQV
jgi:hypothetical protein